MTLQRHTILLQEFIQRLEEKRYYDAHESLEAIWFPRRFEKEPEMLLLKGFINAAVSFELRKRGRPDAAGRVWKNYLKYRPLLEKIESGHLGSYRKIAGKIETIRRIDE